MLVLMVMMMTDWCSWGCWRHACSRCRRQHIQRGCLSNSTCSRSRSSRTLSTNETTILNTFLSWNKLS